MNHTSKQKIVIVGGTGFVGQGIINHLAPELFDIHCLARHEFSSTVNTHVIYHVVDLNKPQQWQTIVTDADWVIDAVGILFPNPFKNKTYQNSSITPAKQLIDVLKNESKPNFLFVSANSGPFFMKPYLNAKRFVENEANVALGKRAFMVYPGIIFDKDRLSSYLPGLISFKLNNIPYFKKLRSISRQDFAKEIEQILLTKESFLRQRV